MRISKIENNVQDTNSEAWKRLCNYIDVLAENGGDEFSPRDELGDLFKYIYTLPQSISKLKKVKKVWLYGSSLKRIPPEIGKMESLEFFDPYTSHGLHWFPYEITKCQNLKDSRISTRVLYGNFKNRMIFPCLESNPVRYTPENKVSCSICNLVISYDETEQYWVSLNIATDIVPLLVNVCSEKCKEAIETPAEYYVPFPHKGGSELQQPLDQEEIRLQKRMAGRKRIDMLKSNGEKTSFKDLKPLKLIHKLWEK